MCGHILKTLQNEQLVTISHSILRLNNQILNSKLKSYPVCLFVFSRHPVSAEFILRL